jgi:RIO kinase 1
MATLSSERNMHGESTAEDLVKEEVFKQTYIPQRLDEVSTFEFLYNYF